MSAPQLYRLPAGTRRTRQIYTLCLLALIAGISWLACVVASSRLAYLLNYPPELGAPIFSALPLRVRIPVVFGAAAAVAVAVLRRQLRHLPLALLLAVASLLATAYPPYRASAYLFSTRSRLLAADYPALVASADLWGAGAFAATAAALLPALVPLRSHLLSRGDLHGSARLATGDDILASEDFLLDAPGAAWSRSSAIPLGAVEVGGRTRLLRVKSDSHLLLLAPPGAGKTTSLVIPAAQDWTGPLICLDVKGEISQLTAGFRARNGSRILILNPSSDDPAFVRYNPLLSIRPEPFDVQDAQALAKLLVPDPPSGGGEAFWRIMARDFLTGLILHVLYAEPAKSLAGCHAFLTEPARTLVAKLESMIATQHEPQGSSWRTHPSVASAARSLLDMAEPTRAGVVAQAISGLTPYTDPILARATATSDFSLEELFLKVPGTDPRPVTLYIAIDPNSLGRLADHIRIVISQIVAALTRPTDLERHRVLLLLDEFPTFKRMEIIESAIAYLRGYSVQAYIVVQHQGQLNQYYGQHESVSSNCPVHIAFAPSDLDTARRLSERVGKRTVHFERGSISGRGFLDRNRSTQESETGRPVLMPEEIGRLPRGQALVLRTGMFPIITKPMPYFRDAVRSAATKYPLPTSEPIAPDFSHWTTRLCPRPSASRTPREERTKKLAHELRPWTA